ncbi:hypothetical protein [Marivirga sp.]|uniref:hypothetical protein n=1 Tax=Marivirga sp. TaxID=2018662 RepID=UPI002D7EDBA6|nr:hypothetical protein [Marivirga sp.]HET8861362.1 hypothetical protein [Marivirga sp.]
MKNIVLNLILLLFFSNEIILASDKLPPKILTEFEFTNELQSLKTKKIQQHRLTASTLNVRNPSSYINDYHGIRRDLENFEKQMQSKVLKGETIEYDGKERVFIGGMPAYYMDYEGIKKNEEIWSFYGIDKYMIGTDYYKQFPPKKIYEIRIETSGKYAYLTRLDTEGYYPNGKIYMGGWEKINGAQVGIVELYGQNGKTTEYFQYQNENTIEIQIDFNEGEKVIDIIYNRKNGAGKYRHPEVEEGKWLCWNAEMRNIECENLNQLNDFENIFNTEKLEENNNIEKRTEISTDNSEKRVIKNTRLGYSVSVPVSSKVSFGTSNDGVTGSLKVTSETMKEEDDWTAISLSPKLNEVTMIIIYIIEEKDAYSYEKLKSGVNRWVNGFNPYLKNPQIINEEKDYELAGLNGYLFELEQEDGKAKRYMFQYLDGKTRISIQFGVWEEMMDNMDKYNPTKDYLKNIQIKKI